MISTPRLTPDTQLRMSDNNRIILSYNAVKEMKLSFKKNEMLSALNLSLFYNPEKNFLSGTSTLVFASSPVLSFPEPGHGT